MDDVPQVKPELLMSAVREQVEDAVRKIMEVQKRLGCARAALGSLSEAATVFDPERLIEIIQELGSQLSPIAKDARLKDVRCCVMWNATL